MFSFQKTSSSYRNTLSRLKLFTALILAQANIKSQVLASPNFDSLDEEVTQPVKSESQKITTGPGLTVQEILSEKHFFKPENYAELVKASIQTSLQPSQRDLLLAVPIYEEAARYRHVPSLVNLARFYRNEGSFLEAIKLNILAFQVHWLEKTQHYGTAIAQLTEISKEINNSTPKLAKKRTRQEPYDPSQGNQLNSVQIEHCTFFLSRFERVASCMYPLEAEKKREALQKIINYYGNPILIEPYLNEREVTLKKELFLDFLYDKFGSSEETVKYGHTLYIKGSFKKASYYWEKADCPEGWFYLGRLYEGKKIRYSDSLKITESYYPGALGEPAYKKAKECYKKSKTPVAFFHLANLYFEGKLGEVNPKKAAKYWEKSGLPQAWFRLGNLYNEGSLDKPDYKKAACCYKNADMPETWYNRGILYSTGKLNDSGTPDYVKAKRCYKKAGTSNAWIEIAIFYEDGKLGEKPDYDKAAECYRKSGSSVAWNNLGLLYDQGKLGQDGYRNAAKCFKKAKTPDAWYNLGSLYYDGKLGKCDYKRAAECFEKSKISRAWYLLGEIYRQGKLEEPDYWKAAECYKNADTPDAWCWVGIFYGSGKLGEKPDYDKAAECYRKSGSSDAWNNLGKIYYDGKLGEPDYWKATECFEKTGTPQAWYNIGCCYYEGMLGEPDYWKAAEYWEKAGTPQAWDNLGIVSCYFLKNYTKALEAWRKSSLPCSRINLIDALKSYFIDFNLSQEEAYKEIAQLRIGLEPDLRKLELPEQHYHWGRLAFIEEEYEQALIHFSQATALGYKEAQRLKEETEYILLMTFLKESLEGKKAKEKEAVSLSLTSSKGGVEEAREKKELSLELKSEPSSPELTAGEKADETKIEVIPPSIGKNELEREKQRRHPSNKLSHEERLEKCNIKLREAIEKSKKTLIRILPTLEKKASFQQPTSITFTYLKGVKESLDAMLESKENSKKLEELLDDIKTKPWATEGTGKPEVLKNKFKGYKGCLSRRINHEDRLVYKVIGAGNILILSCKGHYK